MRSTFLCFNTFNHDFPDQLAVTAGAVSSKVIFCDHDCVAVVYPPDKQFEIVPEAGFFRPKVSRNLIAALFHYKKPSSPGHKKTAWANDSNPGRLINQKLKIGVFPIRIPEQRSFVGQIIQRWKGLIRMNTLGFLKEIFLRFLAVLIGDTAIYRAHFLASFFTVEANTLGTEVGIDVVKIDTTFGAVVNRFIGAFGFAHAAVNTFVSDYCCHSSVPF